MRNAPSSAMFVSSVFFRCQLRHHRHFALHRLCERRRHFFQFCNAERLCDRLRQSAFKLRLRHGAQLIDAFAQRRTVAVSALRAVEKRFQPALSMLSSSFATVTLSSPSASFFTMSYTVLTSFFFSDSSKRGEISLPRLPRAVQALPRMRNSYASAAPA